MTFLERDVHIRIVSVGGFTEARHAVVIVVAGSASEVADNAFWAWLSLGLLVGATVWVAFLGRGPLERLTAASARALAGRSSPARAE